MNYNAQVLSNQFKVKDKELVKRLLDSAGFYVDECGGSLCFYDNEEYAGVKEEDVDVDKIEKQDFFKFLQSQLLDGESVQVTEIGHEGLRYQAACGLVITKKAIKWFDLNRLMEDFTKENI